MDITPSPSPSPPPSYFTRFKELPKDIRIGIWLFAASSPRIVELHDHHSTILRNGEKAYHTTVESRTRPSALLQACAESKRVALRIFVPMYDYAHSNCSPHTPIYVNPHTDITYRGLDTEPFRLLGPDHRKDVIPLGVTRTLAVNSKFLAKMILTGPQNKPLSVGGRLRKEDCLSFPEQILACAGRGLKVLIFVVGNNEDLAEFEMEDIDQYDLHAKKALSHAVVLRTNLRFAHIDLLRTKLQLNLHPPAKPPIIKVMKVKSRRYPIPPFHQFSRMPQELQNMV